MKCLFVLSIALDKPGPSVHLLKNIIMSFMDQGHSVVIVSRGNNISGLKTFGDSKYDDRLTSYTVNKKSDKNRGFLFRYLNEIGYARSCAKAYKKLRDVDAVFLQSTTVGCFHTRLIKKYINKPIVFNVQDIFPYNLKYSEKLPLDRITFGVFRWLQHRAYKQSDRIITISEDMKTTLSFDGVPAEKIEVIYNWSYQDTPYDLSALDYTRVAPLFDKDKFNVVYAGNIGMMQNVELVVRTAAKMKEQSNVAFHIFGDGLYKNKLVALAEELGADNLTFHPMLDSADAPALYASADLNVIPLGKDIYRTAFPSKTATCVAAGKPVALCIGKESEFGRKMSESFGVTLLGANDSDELVRAVLSVRESRGAKLDTADFEKYFSSTANSGRYVEIIAKQSEKER